MVALACLASAASAAVITQTQSFPPGSTPFTTGLTFNKFDTSLGTLNGISIALSTTADASVDIINFRAVNQPYWNATATLPVSATTVAGADSVTTTATVVAGPFAGVALPFLPGFIVNHASGLPVTANSLINVLPANFGFYEGLGVQTFGVNVSSLFGTFQGSSPIGLSFGGSAKLNGFVTVTYDYSSAVPEPSTYIAGLGALCLFGFTAIPKRKLV
jgi:hypothetical protein